MGCGGSVQGPHRQGYGDGFAKDHGSRQGAGAVVGQDGGGKPGTTVQVTVQAAGTTGSPLDPAKPPGVCILPGCSSQKSGTSDFCSMECQQKLIELQKVPPPIDPKFDVVVIKDPRPNTNPKAAVGVIAFYYPDREEDCDKICGAGFLGNFWETPEKIRLSARDPRDKDPNPAEKEYKFRNAEAAFQALKFWVIAAQFEELSGDEAFQLKRQNQGYEDFSYGGKGDNWKGMLAVLFSKFRQQAMLEALRKTGDAYLLEHNSVKGRDDTWSDNYDGEGKNWLGMQLMLIRDRLLGRSHWTEFIEGLVDTTTGAQRDFMKGRRWQDSVRTARNALMAKVEELRPKAPCARPTCGKPSWNGQPGEYCSKACRGHLCSKPGCGKPSWNGKQFEYCSQTCRQADNMYFSSYFASPGMGSYGSYGGINSSYTGVGSGSTYGTNPSSHTASPSTHMPQQRHAAGGPSPAAHPSSAGMQQATHGPVVAQAVQYVCKTPGCGKPTFNGLPGYCSKSCGKDGPQTGAHVAAGGHMTQGVQQGVVVSPADPAGGRPPKKKGWLW